MKPPFGMYQAEAMIYLFANMLYHVLPLVAAETFRERSRNFVRQLNAKVSDAFSKRTVTPMPRHE